MRPVCCDERQCLRRPVFLDPPSPHGDSPPDRNLYYPDRDAPPGGSGKPRGPPFLTPPGGACSLPPPLPPLSCQPSLVVRKFRHYSKPYPASPACCAVPCRT